MRKNNIKTIISTALVSIMAISLIGCGSKGNEKSEETVLTNVSFPLEGNCNFNYVNKCTSNFRTRSK